MIKYIQKQRMLLEGTTKALSQKLVFTFSGCDIGYLLSGLVYIIIK